MRDRARVAAQSWQNRRPTEVILIPAPEHRAMIDLGRTPAGEVLASVQQGKCPDEVAAATYLAMDVTRRRARVTLVSDGIDAGEAEKLGLGLERHLERAVAAALDRAGPQARVGVITHAADLLPNL